VKLTLNNRLQEIPPLAEVVADFLDGMGVEQATTLRINLCLDELLTNTIQYGYSDGQPHEISVELLVEHGELHIEIIDDAQPFDPLQESPPPDLHSPLEERPIGGLGLHLVRQLTDSQHYERDPQGRNRLRLIKQLNG
jgi:anti-sigma regulatory factor (Ser/Thr protein kinase)